MSIENEEVKWVQQWRITSRGPQSSVFECIFVSDYCCSSVDQFEGFLGFCTSTRSIPELTAARMHFIDLPGHVPGERELRTSPWPDYQALVEQLHEVIDSLGVSQKLGIGEGTGADLLRRVAEAHPKMFRGLVLVAPMISAPTIFEKGLSLFAAAYVYIMGLNGHALDIILGRWFSQSTLDYNSDLRERFATYTEKLNNRDVAKVLYAAAWREASTSDALRKSVVRGLVICGRESRLHSDALDAYQLFRPGSGVIMEPFSTGSLVLDENPEAIVQAFSLFLRSTFQIT